MCGIAGFWDLNGSDGSALRAMGCALCHRGPDDEGFWMDQDTGVGFAHRRLSILDLSPEGHQPKVSAHGRFTLSFNGEIYNFRELRTELTTLGHEFRSSSDTEVLLAAFEEWGVPGGITRCAGQFAFAVWDSIERQLWLGRDRLGEKPLYFGWTGDALLFSSELKAMRAHPKWAAGINRNALAEFLRLGYVPGPQSIYLGIEKLNPGTLARFDVGQRDRMTHRHVYWSLSSVATRPRRDLPVDDVEITAEFDRVLRRVVEQEMVADVPLGAFLSGGIDSSLIVGVMQALSAQPVRTFTIGFHERGYDEAQHAKAVARHLGTDHTELYVTPDQARQVIPKLPSIYDEPFADPSQIPTYLVSELARRSVVVSLSGDGGDELFGGYNRYFHGARIWRRIGALPPALRHAGAVAARSVTPRTWDRISAGMKWMTPRRYHFGAPGDKIHKLADVLTAEGPTELYTRLTSHWRDARAVVRGAGANELMASHPEMDFISRMMYIDTLGYLPDDILVKVDRASMAVSLESRAPFLHHEIVEFAWRLPLNLKVRGNTGKWLLRALLDRYVPRALIDRPKMGFGVPIDSWLRGPLRDWGEELLARDRLAREGFFDADAVRKKWEEHLRGTRNWQYLLWDVLMFQAWHHHTISN